MADDAIFKGSSHFTYDLVAGIFPGFTVVCSFYLAKHWLFGAHATGVKDVLTDLSDANNTSAFVLFLALILGCHVIGSVCTGIARCFKWMAQWKCLKRPAKWLSNKSETQRKVDAVFQKSRHWNGRSWLRVDDAPDTDHASKWIARKFAVGNDDNSLVTTYHYKYHLYRALLVVWVGHALFALYLMVAFRVGDVPHCEIQDVSWYLVASVVLSFVTWRTWEYYYERYWMAIALLFCMRKPEDVRDFFSIPYMDDLSG